MTVKYFLDSDMRPDRSNPVFNFNPTLRRLGGAKSGMDELAAAAFQAGKKSIGKKLYTQGDLISECIKSVMDLENDDDFKEERSTILDEWVD